jgi:hypothetical protein
MKISDRTGRSMLVDLVYKHPQRGWLQAPASMCYACPPMAGRAEPPVRGTMHVRLPHGKYAIRIASVTGADVILFENGKQLLHSSVPAQTQFIEFDSARQALQFRPAGEVAAQEQEAPADVAVQADDTARAVAGTGVTGGDPQVAFTGPQAPEGHGLVYVVVRFSKQNSPYGEPPQQECELAFQMRSEEDHDEWFANNMHLIVPAPALPNKLDPMSLTPPTAEALQHRPDIRCTFGCCGGHK